MNYGIYLLALLLGACGVLVLIMGAAAQPQGYSDTFGNAMPAATNNTQRIIGNGTATLAPLGSGAVIFIAIIVLGGAAIGLYAIANRHNSRGGRYG